MAGLHHSGSGRAAVTMMEEDDDLEALRVAALASLEAKRLKEVPRNRIVQRNNVLVIQPADDFLPRLEPPVRIARTPSPRLRRKSPIRERSLSPRRRSPSLLLSRSPRRFSPRRSTTPRDRSPRFRSRTRTRSRSPRGRYRSPLPLRRSPRRSSRSPSPRRLSVSPRRRSPLRRRSPVRQSPGRRSPLLRTPPRRSPVRRSPPRKVVNGDVPRRNNTRRTPPPRKRSRSPVYRNHPVEPKRQPDHTQGPVSPRNLSEPVEKKDRFARFQDNNQENESDEDSCNESLLDEILNEVDDNNQEPVIDNIEADNKKQQEGIIEPEVSADDVKENKASEEPDEDCLLLQADDDMDDLLGLEEEEAVVTKQPAKTAAPVKDKKPLKTPKRTSIKEREERRRDDRTDRRENRRPDPPQRSERDRRERKENRDRRDKPVKPAKVEKRTDKERETKRHKEKSKEPAVKKVAKPSKVKEEAPAPRAIEDNKKMSTVVETVSSEQRQRFEARKRKFEQAEIKPAKKVISLKKDGSDGINNDKDASEDSRPREHGTISSSSGSGSSSRKGGIQERLGAKDVRSTKVRTNPRGEKPSGAEEDVVARRSILSRLGPPSTAARTVNASTGAFSNVKERIGHFNSESCSPPHRGTSSSGSSSGTSSLLGSSAADVISSSSSSSSKVKFEVRNRATLDPKLKLIHINLPAGSNGSSRSGGSHGGSSGTKQKRVFCVE